MRSRLASPLSMLVVVAMVGFISCTKEENSLSPKTSDSLPKPTKASLLRSYLAKDSDTGSVKQWHGQTLAKITDALGTPDTSQLLSPNKVDLLEYQIELYNWIDKENKELIIKETSWTTPRDGSQRGLTLYVWFQKKNEKWISIHSLIHDERVEF